MANQQTSVSRVTNRAELPLLLDKARQFAGQYIESLEERPVLPRASHDLIAPRVQGWSAPRIISRTIARRGKVEGVSLTNSLM